MGGRFAPRENTFFFFSFLSSYLKEGIFRKGGRGGGEGPGVVTPFNENLPHVCLYMWAVGRARGGGVVGPD